MKMLFFVQNALAFRRRKLLMWQQNLSLTIPMDNFAPVAAVIC